MTRQHLLDMGVTVVPIKGNLSDPSRINKIKKRKELQAFESYWIKEKGEFMIIFKGLLTTYGWKVKYNNCIICY